MTRGYHGTKRDAADEIVKTQFKPCAPNSGSYLGEGVYFFDNQPSHAEDWAENQVGNRVRGTPVAVIESEIRYGNLLNLTDHKHFFEVRRFKDEFEKKTKTKTTLATIIDIVAAQTKAEVVKATRIRANGVLMENSFSSDVELILAVRELRNILSKRVVLSWMIGYK